MKNYPTDLTNGQWQLIKYKPYRKNNVNLNELGLLKANIAQIYKRLKKSFERADKTKNGQPNLKVGLYS